MRAPPRVMLRRGHGMHACHVSIYCRSFSRHLASPRLTSRAVHAASALHAHDGPVRPIRRDAREAPPVGGWEREMQAIQTSVARSGGFHGGWVTDKYCRNKNIEIRSFRKKKHLISGSERNQMKETKFTVFNFANWYNTNNNKKYTKIWNWNTASSSKL